MPLKRGVVFALDCEMITGIVAGKRKQLAGRIVLIKSDKRYGYIKVLDTYITYDPSVIVKYNTKWSHIEPWMVAEGLPREIVISFLLHAICGHTLVTFSGKNDLDSLGLDAFTLIHKHSVRYIDLQDYFKRQDNGSPYGLGPLVEYFGYRKDGRRVIINHHCVEDAFYTLRLYVDYYRPDSVFQPDFPVLSMKEYKTKYDIL